MYISQATLKTKERGGAGALASFLAGASEHIGYGHHLVWSLFGDKGGDRPFLYRTVGNDLTAPITLVSSEPPADNHQLWDIRTKTYALLQALKAGDRIIWSLRVNAMAHTAKGRMCVVEAARDAGDKRSPFDRAQDVIPGWLAPRLAAAGLTATSDQIGVHSFQINRFRRTPKAGPGPNGNAWITVSMADTGGTATVADPVALQEAVANGVGRSKAYGCGLLLVRRDTSSLA